MEYSDFLPVWKCSEGHTLPCSDRHESSALVPCSYKAGSLSNYGALGDFFPKNKLGKLLSRGAICFIDGC